MDFEEQNASGLPLRACRKYFLAGANCFSLLLVVFVLIFSQVITSGSDYFINYWTQQEYNRAHGIAVPYSSYDYLYMYTGLIITVVIVCLLLNYHDFIINKNHS